MKPSHGIDDLEFIIAISSVTPLLLRLSGDLAQLACMPGTIGSSGRLLRLAISQHPKSELPDTLRLLISSRVGGALLQSLLNIQRRRYGKEIKDT